MPAREEKEKKILHALSRLVEENKNGNRNRETLDTILSYCTSKQDDAQCMYIAARICEEKQDDINALRYYHTSSQHNHPAAAEKYKQIETTIVQKIPKLRDSKEYASALEYCTILLTLNPQHTHATYFAGTIYAATQNIDNAIACFESLPNHTSAQAYLAKLKTK